MLEQIGWLAVLAVVAFLQNMAFTWVSRSRNSGDPAYHRWAAYCSNTVWLICHLLVWKHIWGAFQANDITKLIPMIAVYAIATSEGSVFMMKKLLKTERGSRRVGSRG